MMDTAYPEPVAPKAPLRTDWAGRLIRFGVVVGGMVVATIPALVLSSDFRDALTDLLGASWATIVWVFLTGVATQVAGNYLRKPPKEGGPNG